MYRLILGNWKLALIWALGTCASVGFFFADGGDERLTESVEQASGDSGAAVQVIGPAEPAEVDPDEETTEDWGEPSAR
jgi:hypothetical protein